jgi:hypothetical protein
MTQRGYPFDAGEGLAYELDWSLMAKKWRSDGVIQGIGTELAVFADSTGMQVKIPAGDAWVRGHYYHNDAQVTQAIAAANATNPRIDRIVLRIDYTANTIRIAALTGVAAGSPVAPAVTQNDAIYEYSLATVLVDAAVGTIAAGKVTSTRNYSAAWQSAEYADLFLTGAGVLSGSTASIRQSRTGAVTADYQLVAGASGVSNQYGLFNTTAARYEWFTSSAGVINIPQGFTSNAVSLITGNLAGNGLTIKQDLTNSHASMVLQDNAGTSKGIFRHYNASYVGNNNYGIAAASTSEWTSTEALSIGTSVAASLTFGTNAAIRMTIASGGAVSMTGALTVQGQSIAISGANSFIRYYNAAAANSWTVGDGVTASDGVFSFYSQIGGASVMQLSSNGSVVLASGPLQVTTPVTNTPSINLVGETGNHQIRMGTYSGLQAITSNAQMMMLANAYYNGTNYTRVTTFSASRVYLSGNTMSFDIVASGAAGSTFSTWTNAISVDTSGGVTATQSLSTPILTTTGTNGIAVSMNRTGSVTGNYIWVVGAQGVTNQFGLLNNVTSRYEWYTTAGGIIMMPQGFSAGAASSVTAGGLQITAGGLQVAAGGISLTGGAAALFMTSSGTGANYIRINNTGGDFYVGLDTSTGSTFSNGNYAGTVWSPTNLAIRVGGGTLAVNVLTTGVANFPVAISTGTGTIPTTGIIRSAQGQTFGITQAFHNGVVNTEYVALQAAAGAINVGQNALAVSLTLGAYNSMIVDMQTGSAVRPVANNSLDLGNTSFRWATIYSVNALNTSHSSYKTDMQPVKRGDLLNLARETSLYTYGMRGYTDERADWRFVGFKAEETDRLLSIDGTMSSPTSTAAVALGAVVDLEHELRQEIKSLRAELAAIRG